VDPIRILLVEDYLPDVRLTQRAFRQAKVPNQLDVAIDGVEALDYLRKQGKFSGVAELPHLILLDLNMPRMDGRSVLQQIQADEDLKHIPVIVLTTSKLDLDVSGAYKLGANAYVVKPVTFDAFVKAVATIEDFWLSLVVLP